MWICFVGDSLVNGTGDPEYLGWTGRICAAARKAGRDITCYNLGVRRETSADIRARWLREVSRRLPAGCDGGVVFSFGINDTTWEGGAPRVAVADSVEHTRRILITARRRFPVLMIGPSPVTDAKQNLRIAGLSRRFAFICRELEVPYLEVFTPLAASETWMREVAANDGSHPGSAGYSELARLVQDWPPWLSWFK